MSVKGDAGLACQPPVTEEQPWEQLWKWRSAMAATACLKTTTALRSTLCSSADNYSFENAQNNPREDLKYTKNLP